MLHKNLKRLRHEYDISAARIAKFLQVDVQDIDDWEVGTRKPSLHQIHQLADLFDISYQDLVGEEDNNTPTSRKTSDKKGKNKTKKKTKHKNKTKKVKNKKVEKRQNWPLIIILILLLCAGAVGGYIYWKYGNEYSIIKNDSYTVDELVGTFQDESNNKEIVPILTLVSDKTYALSTSDCSVESAIAGTWTVKGNTITLTSTTGDTYTLRVASTNKLKFTSETIGCAPIKNDIFTRGSVNTDDTSTDSNNTQDSVDDEQDNDQSSSYIELASYSGNNATLRITQVTTTSATFTLQSYDPDDSANVASLTAITGSRNGNTLTFTFQDDGYGNAGSGTIVFDANQCVFDITLSTMNPDATWSIATSGTLMK